MVARAGAQCAQQPGLMGQRDGCDPVMDAPSGPCERIDHPAPIVCVSSAVHQFARQEGIGGAAHGHLFHLVVRENLRRRYGAELAAHRHRSPFGDAQSETGVDGHVRWHCSHGSSAPTAGGAGGVRDPGRERIWFCAGAWRLRIRCRCSHATNRRKRGQKPLGRVDAAQLSASSRVQTCENTSSNISVVSRPVFVL
jgi:hypothetical protein